jgi:hypothetical protein
MPIVELQVDQNDVVSHKTKDRLVCSQRRSKLYISSDKPQHSETERATPPSYALLTYAQSELSLHMLNGSSYLPVESLLPSAL